MREAGCVGQISDIRYQISNIRITSVLMPAIDQNRAVSPKWTFAALN
jgi:hypothetical protein